MITFSSQQQTSQEILNQTPDREVGEPDGMEETELFQAWGIIGALLVFHIVATTSITLFPPRQDKSLE